VVLDIKDTLWLRADGVYFELKMVDQKILIRSNIKSFMEELSETQLTRIHRSYVVNIDAATAISKSKIHFSGGAFPIGVSYKEDIQEMFQELCE
tara:strand:+ start:2359 stop:2640 length:282 start_codon:yes stop_codon:yes gene_type:complete